MIRTCYRKPAVYPSPDAVREPHYLKRRQTGVQKLVYYKPKLIDGCSTLE